MDGAVVEGIVDEKPFDALRRALIYIPALPESRHRLNHGGVSHSTRSLLCFVRQMYRLCAPQSVRKFSSTV